MQSEDAPTRPPQTEAPAKWPSLALSAIVHLLLVAALFFGVQWKSQAPKSVEVEVWRSAPAPTAVGDPEQEPQPKPKPKPEPQPEPKPVAKPEPKPEPKPVPKPEPKPPVKPDIPLKEDKKPKEPPKKEEPRVKEPPKKEEPKVKEPPKKEEPKAKEPAKKEPPKPDPRPSFDQELEREKKQLEKQKAAEKAAQKAADDQRARAAAEARQLKQLQADQAAAERARGLAEYIDKVRGKIRGNITLPPGIEGNPEALFEVTQLPSGDVLDVKIRRSSGNPALDAAVERAIRKSSPLPKPARADLFDRVLNIPYRPREN